MNQNEFNQSSPLIRNDSTGMMTGLWSVAVLWSRSCSDGSCCSSEAYDSIGESACKQLEILKDAQHEARDYLRFMHERHCYSEFLPISLASRLQSAYERLEELKNRLLQLGCDKQRGWMLGDGEGSIVPSADPIEACNNYHKLKNFRPTGLQPVYDIEQLIAFGGFSLCSRAAGLSALEATDAACSSLAGRCAAQRVTPVIGTLRQTARYRFLADCDVFGDDLWRIGGWTRNAEWLDAHACRGQIFKLVSDPFERGFGIDFGKVTVKEIMHLGEKWGYDVACENGQWFLVPPQ